MASALVDTTVLYAAGNRRANRHETALEIVHFADDGELPILRIPDVVAVETMNGLLGSVGHRTAADMLMRFQEGSRFALEREPDAVWHRGLATFETVERLSLADAIIVASARHHDVEYLYSFDGDFDGLDGIVRLTTPENPFGP